MEREDRYIVVKKTDAVAALTDWEQRLLGMLHSKVDAYRQTNNKNPLQCVVVEKDWPEYEPTWKAIVSRIDPPVQP